MGGCQCRTQEIIILTDDYELNDKQNGAKKRIKDVNSHSSKDSHNQKNDQTSQFSHQLNQTITKQNQLDKFQLIFEKDDIGEELQANLEVKLPPFVKEKRFSESLKLRSNRFIEDLEFEVRLNILKIRQEEEKQKVELVRQLLITTNNDQKNIIQSSSQQQQQQQPVIQRKSVYENEQILSEIPSQLHTNNQQVVPNIQKSTSPISSKPVVPSKFANTGVNFEEVKISSLRSLTQNSKSKKSYQNSKNVIKKIQSIKDGEINSAMASNGSNSNETQKKKMNLNAKALEKIFSDFYIGDRSMYSQKSSLSNLKSILKESSLSKSKLSRSKSNKTSKTEYAGMKSKKKHVRFSQDTNFNYERKFPKQLIRDSNWLSYF